MLRCSRLSVPPARFYEYEIKENHIYATGYWGTLEFDVIDDKTLKLGDELFHYEDEEYLNGVEITT